MASLMDPFCGFFMAQTAENLAREHDISRAEQDAYALRSQQAAAAAVEAGKLAEEIIPVTVGRGKRQRVIEVDDHVRADATAEGLPDAVARACNDYTAWAKQWAEEQAQ